MCHITPRNYNVVHHIYYMLNNFSLSCNEFLLLQITTATVGDLVRIKINASTSRGLGFATIGVTGCAAFDGNPALNNANYSFTLIGENGYVNNAN